MILMTNTVERIDIEDFNKGHNLYNRAFKERFIDENYTTGANNVRNIFDLASKQEKALDKDLGMFNLFEADNLLVSLNRGTASSVATALSILRKYTDYYIEQGENRTRINYYRTIKGKERIKRYINKQSDKMAGEKEIDRHGRYINRQKLHDMMDICINPQDAALFGIFFEGAGGVKHEEIINLKKDDCNFETGIITLTRTEVINKISKESVTLTRNIHIHDKLILDRIKRASKQTVYEVNNGDNHFAKTPTLDLIDEGYVFKPTSLSRSSKLAPNTINSRISIISKLYRNEFINAQSLKYSGVIDYLQNIKETRQLKDIGESEYREVISYFNLSNNENYWYALKDKIDKYI